MQACAQVLQGGRKSAEGDLLRHGSGLPETLESQRDVGRFALQAAGCRSTRMVVQPGEHDLAEAALQPDPCLVIPLGRDATEQFEAVGLIVWLPPTRRV